MNPRLPDSMLPFRPTSTPACNFGASLLVARGGKIVHRANLGTVAPNRPAAGDDRYLLMSMS
ncbi:MAG TPA: hypothetical protein VFT36_11335, partial [Methylomirabilota bacterium]|nr:hypothetical protein [Methylomirabilota bacterium]